MQSKAAPLNIVNKKTFKYCKICKNQHNVSMNQFNLGNFINKFVNYALPNPKGGTPQGASGEQGANFPKVQNALNQEQLVQKALTQPYAVPHTFNNLILADLRMNNLASFEKSLYVRDLMKMPKEIEQVLTMIQNNGALPKEATELLTKNISLTTLAELIQTGGKEAMNKLVLVMAEASKQGLNDLSQIKETIKFINASVSVASSDNPNQILKNFMLLYLPWFPLQEGVDFELEIESSEGENEESELSITVMISTKNYGNVRATLILLAGNSMNITINCCRGFPKEELLKRLREENKRHSIQSDITFEEQKMINRQEGVSHQAKVSMSNLMEVNPFLLLMANALIRHTIELDNEAGN